MSTSRPPLRIALIAVGDELLRGEQVNGNGATLGAAVVGIGGEVVSHHVVGDDVPTIRDAVLAAVMDADAVIVSGGLGPTQDDLTREGLAAAAGVEVFRNAEVEAQLRVLFAERAGGRPVAEMNWRQADVPAGAEVLTNPVGSAPGLRIVVHGTDVYALPGVPSEFAAMLTEVVLPDVARRFPDRPVVVRRVLRTVGLWESAVAQAMSEEVDRVAATTHVSFIATAGETQVIVTASGPTQREADALVDPTVATARTLLGSAVYDAPSLEDEVVRVLSAGGATVAFAESLTAGAVSARLANVAGASAVLRGGVVVYATDLKASLLDISRSKIFTWQAVSPETAEAMATAVAERCEATYGVALTGVAGPAEQDGHRAGTVFIAVSGPGGVGHQQFSFPGGRAQVRTFAATSALTMLRAAAMQDAGGR